MPFITATEWEAYLNEHPEAHLLQTAAWGSLKADFGWTPAYVLSPGCSNHTAGPASTGIREGESSSGAQVLFRKLPLGLSLAYIPKGPVGNAQAWPELWREVDDLCRSRRAVFLKVEPDLWEGTVREQSDDVPDGFVTGEQDIQPTRTLVIDITGTEEQVLARMKQKTRYNIRLALKKEIIVRPSGDLVTFHRLMRATGSRDGFSVHSLAYYRRAYDLFHPKGECELLLAEYQGKPIAAVMVFARSQRAWYFYGASTDEHRECMPTYLLQWEGMRWARAQGCTTYDLWGVPDADEHILEASFLERSDGLWGVYRFKRGFGGLLKRALGPWDRVYSPVMYRLYLIWNRYRSISG